jgi:hypothetical protein
MVSLPRDRGKRTGYVGGECDPAGLATAATAQRLGTASTALFAIGLATAGAALVLRLTEPAAARPPERAKPTFAAVLAVGPRGGVAGLRGIW